MASSLFPSIPVYLLRLCMRLGMAAALLAAIGVMLAVACLTRQERTGNLRTVIAAIAANDAIRSAHTNPGAAIRYLETFPLLSGMTRLCLYDMQNRLLGEKHDVSGATTCPVSASQEEPNNTLFTLHLGQKVERNGMYLGMVRAEGMALAPQELLVHDAVIVCTFLLGALATSALAAQMGARSIGKQLALVRTQMECLANHTDSSQCAVPEHSSAEMTELMTGMSHLHGHLAKKTIPKDTFERFRNWHRYILSAMFGSLRRRMNVDSPLLQEINDYTLMMYTEYGDALHHPIPFDLATTLDTALAGALKIHPCEKHLHPSVSLQPGTPRHWAGYPMLLEALLRHLICIGLGRAQRGLVIRLETTPLPGDATRGMLRIRLEDSGPPIQRWQLQQWLKPLEYREPPSYAHCDISWTFFIRLVHCLSGGATAESPTEGGMQIVAWVPLQARPQVKAQVQAVSATRQAHHRQPPLILVVENNRESRRTLIPLFTLAGARIFMVQDHAEALEWATVMSYSAIVLNAALSSSWQGSAVRLREMMHHNLIPQTPLWALTDGTVSEYVSPRLQHVEQFLLKPLQPETIRGLLSELHSPDTEFHHTHDETLRGDLPPGITARLPEMHRELNAQINKMLRALGLLEKSMSCKEAAMQAHAIKSVALSLGYFRLAGLANEIEHAVITHNFAHMPQNWSIIAQCLTHACHPVQR